MCARGYDFQVFLAIINYLVPSPPAYNVFVIAGENIESLVRDLPDEKGARLFVDRLANEQPRTLQ
jgi:hypothetical protein